jgi:hypothetical protein
LLFWGNKPYPKTLTIRNRYTQTITSTLTETGTEYLLEFSVPNSAMVLR